ncbi:hypothetical protein BIT28_10510 [Photobacterium proteolyticum]|uniref:Uncharacterized protein n=1 Tax=Photobacterium proteolyticum TaxID=1903952 RepID=A0A1Q9G6M8_9GAMM|nr:hypothetical protein BIT28_10510 [Photobacterium proteolyticum]
MEKVFDGSDVETSILPIHFDNHRFIIPANELKPISELVSFSNPVKPNEISSLLGYKITALGKLKNQITNWKQCNEALEQRGSITYWVDDSAIGSWRCTEHHGNVVVGSVY